MKQTSIKGLYELGSVEPIPVNSLYERIGRDHVGLGKIYRHRRMNNSECSIAFDATFTPKFDEIYKSYSEIVKKEFKVGTFDFEDSYINPHIYDATCNWHQHNPGMLIAILCDDPNAGTEMSKSHRCGDKDSYKVAMVTKPWVLYLDSLGLYHKAIKGLEKIDRIMLRSYNAPSGWRKLCSTS